MDILERLERAIVDIEGVLLRERTRLAIPAGEVSPGRVRILTTLIVGELDEVVTILRMLYECIGRTRGIQERMQELQGTVPSGTIDETSEEGRRYLEVLHMGIAERAKLTIHIKTLYEWVYHLKELIEADPTIKELVPKEQWGRLNAYAEFRGALIAHKTRLAGYVFAAMRYALNFEKIELMLTAWSPPGEAAKEIEILFGQCQSELSREEAAETSFSERCRILNARQDRFKGELRARVVAAIRKYGAFSENPPDIAEFVANLARELVPKLAGLVAEVEAKG